MGWGRRPLPLTWKQPGGNAGRVWRLANQRPSGAQALAYGGQFGLDVRHMLEYVKAYYQAESLVSPVRQAPSHVQSAAVGHGPEATTGLGSGDLPPPSAQCC